jgi:ribosomal protein S8
VYSASKNIQEIRRRGKHKVILSTNKGVMESENALREGIGGEVLFLIY